MAKRYFIAIIWLIAPVFALPRIVINRLKSLPITQSSTKTESGGVHRRCSRDARHTEARGELVNLKTNEAGEVETLSPKDSQHALKTYVEKQIKSQSAVAH